MRLHQLPTALALTTVLISPLALAEEVKPNPGEVHIVGTPVTFGTGCPEGSVQTVVSDDGTRITIIFSELLAEAGPGIPLSAGRKQCTTNARVHVPAGLTFTIASVDHRGFAQLDESVVATQRSEYYLMGDYRRRTTAFTTVSGPEFKNGKDWSVRDEFAVGSIVWSPCGAADNFNITSAVQVADTSRTRKGRGFMVQDATDGQFQTVLNLTWQKCTN